MLEPAGEVESDTFDRAIDLERFDPRARRTLAGTMAVGFLAMAFVGWPVVWHVLDTAAVLGDAAGSGALVTQDADRAYTRLYTAAYVVSILPLLVAVSAYLLWRRRHAASDRLPTRLLVVLGSLAVLQLASVAVAWGDQFTGRAIQERLTDVGVSIWGRDVIERGWYAGCATLVATAALGSAVIGLGPRRGWWVFAAAFAAVVPAVWFVLGRPYLV
ncbi:hypothetical protein [Aeromicrobium chenweiae]|uniref:Uncharacterized protein n=1 Tax=Aeromicrobium chenweiae TaxID=2079793 RepID=A0A2S0WKJ6_9ACTN|nr:hypothetical protein [Aeromicrobium chenweiae]AWB91794.1 hypothetical protein C3E78_06000 [Aeromicrobium chenweiae]TGN32638.1 hypothetical protein E4L97_07965 [Aeromicrobium chenweiae]